MHKSLLLLAGSAVAQELGLSVSTDGSYSITHDGHPWLSGDDYVVGGLSAKKGDISSDGAHASTGTDALGAYQSTTLSWKKTGSSDVLMETSFRTYASDPGIVVFEQKFPNSLTDEMIGIHNFDYLSDRENGNSTNTDIYSNAFGNLRGGGTPTIEGTTNPCRVVTGDFKLTKSVSGYDAYVPSASGSGFDKHSKDYCGMGSSTHAPAVFDGDLNLTQCQAKCTEVKCKCFDFREHSPSPSPSPSPSQAAAKTVFPSFKKKTLNDAGELNCFSYHGVFPAMKACTTTDYAESHQGGSPLAIYDKSNSSLPMAVLSPLNYPKAHHMTHSDEYFGAGIKATAKEIPAGWSQTFILSAGVGINAGMMAWGDRMLKYTGKPRADKYKDTTHGTIGFWTDNGGYYHYATGDKKWGKNYEEVLPKVKAYHDSLGVPFGHWQFDSWFYPKDGGVNPGGGGGAVTNWTALDSVFPHGMAYIQSQLKLPMVMHNRQWSDKSDYIKHNSAGVEWYDTSKFAIPKDPEKFFTWFFTQQQGWGLTMYEQDWMCTEYDGVSALQENITMGDLWLEGMAKGAGSPASNRTIQYCMPYPNDLLSAAAYPEVTNARATGDYFHASHQWAVGGTSLFYWAIGILPFKDGFYSSTNTQTGGQTKGPEKDPDREALMATLSCAMVGPMDGIELLNKSRVMTTCRGDGLVLKPDKPISTVDACFGAKLDNPTCFVYSTHSTLDHIGTVSYFYSDSASDALTPDMVGVAAADASQYVVYNWYTAKATALASSVALDAGYEGHVYAVVAPVVAGTGYAFVGEAHKYTTAAQVRFTGASTTANGGLGVSVIGTANETVYVCAVKVSDMTVECNTVAFTTAGTKATSFGS